MDLTPDIFGQKTETVKIEMLFNGQSTESKPYKPTGGLSLWGLIRFCVFVVIVLLKSAIVILNLNKIPILHSY